MCSYWNSHELLLGMQNAADTLENKWMISYEVKYTLTTLLNNSNTRSLPKINEELHVSVPREYIHNCYSEFGKKPKCPSIDEWTNKL